jgi:hypothetical protein
MGRRSLTTALLDWLARHIRAIAAASLPVVITLVSLTVVSPWYYAAVALWLLIVVMLAGRLERLQPGALTPKKQTLADLPSTIGWGVAVIVYTSFGTFGLLWAIFELRRMLR